jgi:hypothetical protein
VIVEVFEKQIYFSEALWSYSSVHWAAQFAIATALNTILEHVPVLTTDASGRTPLHVLVQAQTNFLATTSVSPPTVATAGIPLVALSSAYAGRVPTTFFVSSETKPAPRNLILASLKAILAKCCPVTVCVDLTVDNDDYSVSSRLDELEDIDVDLANEMRYWINEMSNKRCDDDVN